MRNKLIAEQIIEKLDQSGTIGTQILFEFQEQADQNIPEICKYLGDDYHCDKYYTDISTGEVSYRFVKQCCMEGKR